ncbi:hypothetical protein AVEN_219446-1 [Araneus ventricosus]|uniref:Uncharacterized protein n=1 Tax=Araneus ventricosus TaxID=182803 RepID=A0A4Y2BM46_ARAVE|nr:hypothetical protein AVEN_219446-1 [Araneus ventricosus]
MGTSDEVSQRLFDWPIPTTEATQRPTLSYFLEQVLPELLQDVPIAIRNQMWFQHDVPPVHFSLDVSNYLNASGGPVPWPHRSHDSFLWGHLKTLVHATQMRISLLECL